MPSVARTSWRTSRERAIALMAAALVIGATAPASAAIGQWTTNGPYGGLVTVLAIDPHTPANLYAAGTSGVFKTSDAGANWARASQGITDPSVDAIAIDPATSTTLYAGSMFGGRMIKSTDGAATWNALATAPTLVASIGIDPQAPATLYASQQGSGIFKSIDSGATWNKIGVATLPTFPTFKSLVVDPHTSATVYAGENSKGVYKSVDGGTTWAPANTGFNGPIIQIWALAIDATSPSTLYASASTSSGQGLYKTTDGGDHWTNVLPVSSVVSIQSIAVDPQTSSTLYVSSSDGKVSRSTNGGTNFSPVTSGLPGYGMTALAINPQSTGTIYGGSTNGIFKTTSSGTAWTATNNGLALTAVNSVAVDPMTPTTIYAGTRYSGIFKSVDGGGSWVSIYTGVGTTGNLACAVPNFSSIAVDPNTPGTLYAGAQCTQSSQVLKSVNGGSIWTPAATGLPIFGGVLTLAIDPQATATLYAGSVGSGLFLTNDAGAHWTLVSGVPSASVTALSITVIPTNLVPSAAPNIIAPAPNTAGDHASPSGAGTTAMVAVGTNGQGAYIGPANGAFAPITQEDQEIQDCINDATSYFAGLSKFGPGILRYFVEAVCDTTIPPSPEAPKGSNGVSVTSSAPSPSPLQRAGRNKSSSEPGHPSTSSYSASVWDAPDGSADEAIACAPAKALVGNPFDPSSFYVGAACGVLRAKGLGAQLVTVDSTGLPINPQVTALGIVPAGNTLYAGTSNGGVYQFTFPPQPPTQLGIVSVNGGASPVAASPFNVVVQAQAADLSPQDVAATTTVQLSVSTGTGSLGGTQTCQIVAGSSGCTVTGATYSKVETGVVLTATRTSGDTLTAGNSAPFDVAAAGATPNFVSAVSRKVHGAAGTFDLPLSNVATNPATEPRQGPAQTIVFTFDKAVNAATVSITEGTATAPTATFSGNDVVVSLGGVTDHQYVTVALTGVASTDGGSGGTGSIRVGFLVGDVNQNRVVSVADLGLVNAQLAQIVNASNYLKDVNANGTLSLADKAITNANLTRALPAP